MPNLTETVQWEAGIYQLEKTDALDAGTNGSGVSNLQPTQLANRTAWLKEVAAGFGTTHKVVRDAATGVMMMEEL